MRYSYVTIYSIILFIIQKYSDYEIEQFRNTTVVKWWNDNIPRTINGETAIEVGADDTPTVFPSYPGLTFVACVGGHGNGEVGLLVSGNKWIYNTTSKQKTYTGVTWYLVYKGTEE